MNRTVRVSAIALALMAGATPTVLLAEDPPAVSAVPAVPPAPARLDTEAGQRSFLKDLHPQTGDIRIADARAVLHLGDRYYFLPAAEARRVLTSAWGNPPEAVSNVLGLVLEKGTTVFDYTWGAVITWRETGHVSDADAAQQDYGAVLSGMQEGEQEENSRRRAAGFPGMRLIGWAQPPSYDKAAHSLIWAREIAVEGDAINSLNYDVRLLGRTGVLSLNMVSGMNHLADVRTAAASFGKAASFEPGASYTDFDSSTDSSAEYGLAGLVAGGAALAVAKKVGFLAIILKFGKFILIGLAAFGAAIVGFFRRMFGAREEDI